MARAVNVRRRRWASISLQASSGCGASRRPSRRFPAATWAPSPASTPPSRSASATSAGPGRSGRAATAARCGRRRCASPTSSSAPTPPPGWRCERAGCRGSTRSPSAASTRAGTSTWRSASRGCSGCPAGGRRCSGSIEVETRDGTISSLISGDGPEQVVCLHGLGSNKTSFFETVAALTPDHTVHAIDLPGFGSSSKPARAAYDAALLRPRGARLHGRDGDRASAPGRQLDGRPDRDRARAHAPRPGRDAQPPGAGAGLPAPPRAGPAGEAAAPRARGDPAPAAGRAGPGAVLEPVRAARSASTRRPPTSPPTSSAAPTARARLGSPSSPPRATSTSTRPHGERGLWTRLAGLRPPALFVWGDRDRLVPAAFSRATSAEVAAARPPGRARRSAATCPRSSCRSAPTG